MDGWRSLKERGGGARRKEGNKRGVDERKGKEGGGVLINEEAEKGCW